MLNLPKWSNLSLSSKGLILLFLPLCLQLGFGIALLHLQQEAESEAGRAIEARRIATEINSLMTDIIKLYTFSTSDHQSQWQTNGYKGYLARPYRALLHQIHEKYKNLDKLTQNKTELNKIVRLSYRPFCEAAEMLEQANRDILAGNIETVIASSESKSKRFATLAREFISQELLLLGKNEDEFANSSNKKQAEIRQTTVKCLFAAVLANIAFTALLARFLISVITSRLQVMSNNAVKLAAQQPLHDPLVGQDEIAKLDHAFHSMAHTITESARSKQEIYNMVAHDLRTPLTAIVGCLEILDTSRPDELSTRNHKLVKAAVRNSTRTIGLVNDLLDTQKLEAGMLELDATTINLAEIFETVSLDISNWLKEWGIQITFAPTKVAVKANQNMLCRVLFNLISNAIKYSPRGSTIIVNIVNLSLVSDMVEITVSDQGPGIPKHMLKAVFDRFRQVDRSDSSLRTKSDSESGSGLGLSICQDFVHLHGGKIWATSEVGKGSTFHFTIPKAEAINGVDHGENIDHRR